MTETVHYSTPPRPGLMLVGIVGLLLIAGGGIAFVGTREATAPEPLTAPEKPSSSGPIVRIDLPHDTFPVPFGEHREAFVASCTQCHSARLVFTQPGFPANKWAAVVAKMVNAHKASLSPAEQKHIVAYLSSVHGE